MAIRSTTTTLAHSVDSGALELDKNLATTAGYATLAGGVVLSGAIGTMVAPVPTLGLSALGGGLIVAGNFTELKARFSGDKEAKPAVTEAAAEPAAA